jgi:hypothetical protein
MNTSNQMQYAGTLYSVTTRSYYQKFPYSDGLSTLMFIWLVDSYRAR